MSEEEMKEELHPKYYQKNVSVLAMFIKAKKVLDYYLADIDILYSIEGADFITGEQELEKLYQAGLRSLILTWNTESKYASGNRSKKGLTEEGGKLLRKAISLGIGIDLSHANFQSFTDIVQLIKEEQMKGKDICCFASHSNSRFLCDRARNLSDHQLKELTSIGGLVGVFSNKNFIISSSINDTFTKKEIEQVYLDHIDHILSIIGEDHVVVATDDMDFCKEIDPEYGNVQLYHYSNVAEELYQNLSRRYNYSTVHKIMYQNAKNGIFDYIRNKEKNKGEN